MVLILATPESELAGWRNTLFGNTISACIGVGLRQSFGDDMTVAFIAVIISIGVMSLTRSLHPPGGATAFVAVSGGSPILQLGYWFPICPILLGSLWLKLLSVGLQHAKKRNKL